MRIKYGSKKNNDCSMETRLCHPVGSNATRRGERMEFDFLKTNSSEVGNSDLPRIFSILPFSEKFKRITSLTKNSYRVTQEGEKKCSSVFQIAWRMWDFATAYTSLWWTLPIPEMPGHIRIPGLGVFGRL